MSRKWRTVVDFVMGNSNGWKKLLNPTCEVHQTAFPKTNKDLEKLGIRFDFAGTIEEGGRKYHRFQAQVNDGQKIPSGWKKWREDHEKGTHAIVATVVVPDSGTKEEVEDALVNAKIDD